MNEFINRCCLEHAKDLQERLDRAERAEAWLADLVDDIREAAGIDSYKAPEQIPGIIHAILKEKAD